MDKYKKLLNDSIIFAIGNFGSKIISLIMVPLYSVYLTRVEYGTIDLVITFVNVLLPIISLSIFESVLRFTIEEKDKQNQISIFSTSVMFTIITSLISIVLYFFIYNTIFKYDYLFYMLIIVILQSFQVLFSQFLRSLNQLKLYAINGLLLTFSMGITNILLLVIFDLKIIGYFFAIIISNVVSIIFMIIVGNLKEYFSLKKIFNKNLLSDMLKYSIPIIPNTLIWWGMNAISRTLILKYAGIEENGLFAMANKIPSLISMLSTIFFQAWQLLAIQEKNNQDSSKTYGIIYKYFSSFIILGTSIFIISNKMLMRVLISSEFYDSWKYVPPLLIAALLSSFANFFAIFYNVSKETKGIFITSFIGGGVNLVLSIISIPLIGVYGATIATIVSFFVIWIIRQNYSSVKYSIKYNNVKIILSLSILILQTLFLYMNTNYEFYVEIILFSLLCIINKDFFSILIKRIGVE
ncbi:lipopolysaccharide biosynthesis protein [Vagococcus fluvialis]|uniref:lipopolysaccharide biosynthesis protein n=1 Tax=Vagococcus fluvialis TaxID=2738 RepID=UPI003B5C53E8